ncbi:MAG: DoxX family protein [Armatimonadota bacterium]
MQVRPDRPKLEGGGAVIDRDNSTSLGLLWLRVLCGAGIAMHGYQKIFGGNMPGFIESVGKMGFPLPEVFAWLAAGSEFVGGLLLILGLATRVAAFFVFLTMTVAAFVAHAGDPISTKELALAYFAMSACLALTGAGSISLDALIADRPPKAARTPPGATG